MSITAKDNMKKGSTQLSHLCDLNAKKQISHRRLVSIIATISRASRNLETIYNMLLKGVNIFRLNFSHESHELHTQTIELVNSSLQRIKHETGQTITVAFAVDTRGPQIRTGLLDGGNEILLRSGESIRLSINRDLYDKGSKEAVYVDYPNIINVAKPEDRVFVDDGKLFLNILEVGVDGLLCNSGVACW
ncbi:pyruvate kinase-like [Drosophila innubila]|uniref:pyruvate kinase-like n=1 Tax=Drosophila innubila TaxID=198719 RepID=UPI00148CF226|nr:pyruvate kinase-like [Drosophila innubila]